MSYFRGSIPQNDQTDRHVIAVEAQAVVKRTDIEGRCRDLCLESAQILKF